jgi:hypothetical protein
VTLRHSKRRKRTGVKTPDRARLTRSQEADQREPLADARIRPLLEQYVAAAGAELREIEDGLVELHVPAADRASFQRRSSIRIAFMLDALERDPEAEIAVVGSPLVEQLVTAIRSRGSRVVHGFVAPSVPPSQESAELRIPVTNGSASAAHVEVARHRVVRLLARVVVSAGSTVEEHLIESGYFDATTGTTVPADVAAECDKSAGPKRTTRARGAVRGGVAVRVEPGRSGAELVSIALADLRASFEPKVQLLRAEAARALEAELYRIDSYYTSLLEGAGAKASDAADAESRRAYESEHTRRRAEEERRHQVRVVVHPVQLTEWELLVQCAQWEITTVRQEHGGRLVAQRWLNGSGAWTFTCPGCGASTPNALAVCNSGHIACDACASACGTCSEVFCSDHGIDACHVDGKPACSEHARTCSSCREPYCTAHEATCADGEHPACVNCVVACALCARAVCDEHATLTAATESRTARRLCGSCMCHCEGGTNEPVGRDEVSRCASCGKSLCEDHQSTCDVDHGIHCSKHMRRTDGSRRLVCAEHRAECALEPGAMVASDEVGSCSACGRPACDEHSQTCVEDGQRYCHEHVLALRREPGVYACTAHAAVCHIDRAAYRLDQVVACPVCARSACTTHSGSCQSCGRVVCLRDLDARRGTCVTCARLTAIAEPPDHVIAAAVALLGPRQTPRHWKTARDAEHTVVQAELGWKRQVVFVVRHGDNVASGGKNHSMVRSKPLSGNR